MKRTRRIEIVRYIRRVTVSEAAAAAADPVADQLGDDLILDALAGISTTRELVKVDGSVFAAAVGADRRQRRLLFGLRDLLRWRR